MASSDPHLIFLLVQLCPARYTRHMKLLNQNEAQSCADALLAWFKDAMRPLPWRKSYLPYEVWISEVMLQQTQMERGVRHFLRWMNRFPDVRAVAAAPEEDILHAWEGLGYYRRARFVQAAATAIVERHGGNIPDDEKALAALPGLGPYTVAAILAIAFNKDVLCVDANVERVFSACWIWMPPRVEKMLPVSYMNRPCRCCRAARPALQSGTNGTGRTDMRQNAALPECPVRHFCESCRLGIQRERPVPMAKIPTIDVLGAYGVLMKEQHVFLIKRPEQGLWGGLWEFPGMISAAGESPESAVRRVFREKFAVDVDIAGSLGTVRLTTPTTSLWLHFFRYTVPQRRGNTFSHMEKAWRCLPLISATRPCPPTIANLRPDILKKREKRPGSSACLGRADAENLQGE